MAQDTAYVAVAARITGRVQGVWFRGWVRQQARQLGLTGWVRNEPDGSVAAVFVGQSESVDAILALCHGGPPLARKDRLDATPFTPVPTLAEFTVER
jgi:acylphosphatase